MKEITVTTQAELDALPAKFDEYTKIYIRGGTEYNRISVKARGNSSVVARDNSFVVAWENSSVEARGNSSVEAWGNSLVVAWENSSVEAWENSSVMASGNSSVEAWGNSSVVAWGNSSVEAWENSSVVASGNSSVVAWENSSVVAWENCGVHLQSNSSSVSLYAFAVCWVLAKGKVQKKSKTATIIRPTQPKNTSDWLNNEAVKQTKSSVVLFKRVSSDWKTQEGKRNETVWIIGTTLTHSNWSPKDSECGPEKFHACSHPYFCDEFRSKKDDKYIAIKIAIEDLYMWPNANYHHKIAFRSGKVLYQCDRFGKKIK